MNGYRYRKGGFLVRKLKVAALLRFDLQYVVAKFMEQSFYIMAIKNVCESFQNSRFFSFNKKNKSIHAFQYFFKHVSERLAFTTQSDVRISVFIKLREYILWDQKVLIAGKLY